MFSWTKQLCTCTRSTNCRKQTEHIWVLILIEAKCQQISQLFLTFYITISLDARFYILSKVWLYSVVYRSQHMTPYFKNVVVNDLLLLSLKVFLTTFIKQPTFHLFITICHIWFLNWDLYKQKYSDICCLDTSLTLNMPFCFEIQIFRLVKFPVLLIFEDFNVHPI